MSLPSGRELPPPELMASGEDDVILLTEVLGEAPSEVALEIDAEEGLKSLQESLPKPALPDGEEPGSLDDFLASPEELPAEEAPSPFAPAVPSSGVELDTPADIREAVRQELQRLLQGDELQALIREVVQETAARLCRELFPPVAEEVIGREIEALKRRLAAREE